MRFIKWFSIPAIVILTIQAFFWMFFDDEVIIHFRQIIIFIINYIYIQI